MADGSDQTIKQMLQGFSAMQFNLGLLPMQTSQSMAGAPMQMPPPPPPMMHPGQAAAAAMAQQQQMIQQTLQAAQVTRYQPPPSAPTPVVSSLTSMSIGNPFAAPPVGGGSFAPAGGGRGSYAMPGMGPQLPSVFNPFAATLPQAHFASPAMRNLQIMNSAQSQMTSTMAGIGEGAMGIGGSAIGAALGSAFGPIGTVAGGYLGSKIGGGIANMMFNPAVQDMARGRQIQAMSASFMTSGSFMNAATGQGMNTDAARRTATGLRHLQYDHDFSRTGFNTQDTLGIMQASADAGLIKGAQSPDALVSKVKDIAKTVKVLMRITGDPDVRSAIQSLGEMRDMGFQGLGMQGGAVANRATFARMAGVSQGAMGQYGQMGAGMAGNYGLAGATGYSAGMVGAMQAQAAVSSGALNDLQLSRAGGKSGLAAINTQVQLSAMNDERYLLAAMGRDKSGKMTVDADAYKRAQGMSFDEVTNRSADALRNMGPKGIFEWNNRKQELKDRLSQAQSPLDKSLNAIKQVEAFQARVPGMSFAAAAQQVHQLSESDARSYEQQVTSGGWYDAQTQQMQVMKRVARDDARAARDRLRTQGVGTRIGRGIRSAIGGISDDISAPFQGMADRFRRTAEDEEAADQGEHIVRIKDSAIAHDSAEVEGARRVGRTAEYQRAFTSNVGGDPLNAGGRALNRLGSALGVSTLSTANRAVGLARESYGSVAGTDLLFGSNMLKTVGSPGDAMARLDDVSAGAALSRRGGALTVAQMRTSDRKLGSGTSYLAQAGANLAQELGKLQAGKGIFGAQAASRSTIRKAWVDANPPEKRDEAGRQFDADPSIGAQLVQGIKDWGTQGQKETIAKMEETDEKVGALRRAGDREGLKTLVDRGLEAGGLKDKAGGLTAGLMHISAEGRVGMKVDVSDATLTKLGKVFAHQTDDEIGLAAARAAKNSEDPTKRAAGVAAENALRKKLGEDKFRDLEAGAKAIRAAGGDVQTALGNMPASSIQGVRTSLDARKRGAMDEGLIAKLGGFSSKAGAAKSVVEAAQAMSPDEVEAITDPDLKEKVLAMRTGSKADQDKAAEDASVTHGASAQTETRYGGKGNATLDKAEAELRATKGRLAKGDATESELSVAGTELFGSYVEQFGAYVKDLKGSSQESDFIKNNPFIQSVLGDRR